MRGLTENFAERLKDLMAEHGVSSVALADALNVDLSMIYHWRNGTKGISGAAAIAIADYFECSLEHLISRTQDYERYVFKPCPPFAPRLRELITKKGMSIYKFCRSTRFRDYHFHKWSKGMRPKLATLVDLSNALGCTLDYLVGRE